MRRFALVAALTLAGITGAAAQDTTVIRRDAPLGSSTTVIDSDAPRVVEKRTTETTGALGNCETKTVSKTDEDGNSKTVTKRSCD